MPWYTSEAFSIFMFFVPPIAALIALFWIRRKLIWVSIPITVLIDGVIWGTAITGGGSHGKIALVFLIPQVIVVILISLFIMWREKRRSNKIAPSCEPKLYDAKPPVSSFQRKRAVSLMGFLSRFSHGMIRSQYIEPWWDLLHECLH